MAVDLNLNFMRSMLLAQGTAAPRASSTRQAGPVFEIAEAKTAGTLEKFEKSVKEFQEKLSQLPPHHKAEIKTIYESVRVVAAKEQAAGKKVERLSMFVGRVVEYCNSQLERIENADPHLLRMKTEHEQLNNVFYSGAALIDALHAYVKDKDAQ